MSESLIEKLKQKAKTGYDIKDMIAKADDDECTYSERYKGKFLEALEEKWVPLKDVLKILEEQQRPIAEMDDFLKELKEQGFIVIEKQKIQELAEWWEIRPRVGDTDKSYYWNEYEAIEEWIGKVEKWLHDGEKKFVEVLKA